jgi:hypothetical protein
MLNAFAAAGFLLAISTYSKFVLDQCGKFAALSSAQACREQLS